MPRRGKRLAGIFYRTVHGDYAMNPLATQGCDRRSGRFHIAGEWRVHYLSKLADTSWKEITKWAGATLERRAFITYTVGVRFARIADLTNRVTCDQFGITPDALVSEDLGPCQALARRLRDEGFEGLLTPSAADPEGINLVIFEDRVLAGSGFGLPQPVREK